MAKSKTEKLEIVFNHESEEMSKCLSPEVQASDSPEAQQAKDCIDLVVMGGLNRDPKNLNYNLLMAFANFIIGDESGAGSASRIAEAAYKVGIMKDVASRQAGEPVEETAEAK